jgi:hypothetical protein
MKTITLTLLAAAAIGAVSIGGASAMPLNNMSAALGESHVWDVRVVCDQRGRCYNTNRRAYRQSQRYVAPQYYNNGYYNNGYYNERRYRGYDRPSVGIGIGPFGFGIY